MEKKKITISLCMGSSCSARGNTSHVSIIQNYVKENNLEDRVDLVGSLCEEKCKQGPNLKINETLYSAIDPNSLLDILDHLFGKGSWDADS